MCALLRNISFNNVFLINIVHMNIIMIINVIIDFHVQSACDPDNYN